MTRMRLVTFRTEDGTRAGRLDGDRVVELEDSDVSALLARGYAAVVAATTATGAEHAYSDLDLAPVLPDPPKIICVGQNYLAHIREQGCRGAAGLSSADRYPDVGVKGHLGPRFSSPRRRRS